MLLICPPCETIFRVERLRLHPSGQPVHCMICDHIRIARLLTIGDRQDIPILAPIPSQDFFATDGGSDLR